MELFTRNIICATRQINIIIPAINSFCAKRNFHCSGAVRRDLIGRDIGLDRKHEGLPNDPVSDHYMPTAQRALPIITSRDVQFPNKYREPKQAWLETMSQLEDEKLGIIDLHPDIFGAYPRGALTKDYKVKFVYEGHTREQIKVAVIDRIDLLQNNVKWQTLYKKIDYTWVPTRAEVRGSNRKPWPQKKTGRARHGNKKSPLWVKGGKALGPRGPKSYFYMLGLPQRVQGLCIALSVKYAQNYLQIVDSLDIPTDDPQYLRDLADTRYWGFSCLYVDDTDVMPRNLAIAASELPNHNLMPVYGLNVFSMLKHETLVLTLAAVEKLEEKLLYQLNKTAPFVKFSVSEKNNTR